MLGLFPAVPTPVDPSFFEDEMTAASIELMNLVLGHIEIRAWKLKYLDMADATAILKLRASPKGLPCLRASGGFAEDHARAAFRTCRIGGLYRGNLYWLNIFRFIPLGITN